MKKIGILGGGQLGLMLEESNLGFEAELYFLDPDPSCSVSAISERVTVGSFKDEEVVFAFGADKDIVTVEIEHVNTAALHRLKEKGVKVFPDPSHLELIQDKGLQKNFYQSIGIPTAPYKLIGHPDELLENDHKFPFVLKSRKEGYDGKGVKIIRSSEDLKNSFDGPCLVEELAPLKNELSVIVARNERGELKSFPPVEMEFDPEQNLVRALISPASIPEKISQEAVRIAELLMEKLGLVGILAVEFFLLENDELWVNEVAPRPHNSGHHTIEGNATSQYQQHLRAILNLELGDTRSISNSVMVNLTGAAGQEGKKHIEGMEILNTTEGAYLHDYHKAITRPHRKMGHITVVHSDKEVAYNTAMDLLRSVRYVSES